MKPQVPDGYGVDYSYEEVLSTRPPKGESERVPTLAVYAHIYRTSGVSGPGISVPAAIGEAILNPRDRFSIRIGKNVALGRAISSLPDRNAARLDRVVALAERYFGSCTVERDGKEPVVRVPGSTADRTDYAKMVDLQSELVHLGLSSVAPVFFEARVTA